MGLPTFQELMLPALQCACRRMDELHVSKLEDDVARLLKLTPDDLARTLEKGAQTLFSSRLNWARSYLVKAGLLEATRRGFVRGTERACELLAEEIEEIDIHVLNRYPEFVEWRERQTTREEELQATVRENPEQQIVANFEMLNAELAREIIERVYAFTPAFFERLIVDLLVRMGYGGGRLEMGRALGRVGDGGVDGVIKEDELGLDVVYVQAKRFAQEKSRAAERSPRFRRRP